MSDIDYKLPTLRFCDKRMGNFVEKTNMSSVFRDGDVIRKVTPIQYVRPTSLSIPDSVDVQMADSGEPDELVVGGREVTLFNYPLVMLGMSLQEAAILDTLADTDAATPVFYDFKFTLDDDYNLCAVLAMEYVEGKSLRNLIASTHASDKRGSSEYHALIGSIFLDVIETLDVCRDRGIIHRDVKPENVLITPENSSYNGVLFDFNVARVVNGTVDGYKFAPQLRRTFDADHDVKYKEEFGVEKPNYGAGTPLYKAPEMASGNSSGTPVSDVFSLGLTFWESLLGHPAAGYLPNPGPEKALFANYSQQDLEKLVGMVDAHFPGLTDIQRDAVKEATRSSLAVISAHRDIGAIVHAAELLQM